MRLESFKASLIPQFEGIVLRLRIILNITGNMLLFTLITSVASSCDVLWCIETKLYLFKKFRNDEIFYSYVMVQAPLWQELIFLLITRLCKNLCKIIPRSSNQNATW